MNTNLKKNHFKPLLNTYLIISFMMCTLSVFGQKETAIWYYGSHGGLDFNSGGPVFLTNGQLDGPEGCATVSTKQGALLFYTDGQKVFNRNHVQMPNGSGLLGTGTPAQAAIIVQKPGNENIYYIFTASGQEDNGVNGLNYYEVNLTRDGGLGDVTLRNGVDVGLPSSPLATPVTEKLTAIAHSDGKQIWVICHSADNNNNFLAYLVSETGVNTTPVISSIGMVNDYAFDHNCVGHLKVSPNGKKIASGTMYVGSALVPVPVLTSGLELFDFDTATGRLSNPQLLNTAKNYGVEFSANSKVLYVTNTLSGNANRIVQYDITQPTTAAIVQSELIIPSATDLGTVQLAIDGKIYVARGGIDGAIGVINSPATLGTGCGYQSNAIFSGTATPGLGFPNFLPSLFEEKITYDGLCANSPTRFTINPYIDIRTPLWNFGDTGSGSNTSTDVSPFHTYTAPGVYPVSVVFFNAAGTRFEITSSVTIIATPVANTPANLTACKTATPTTFNLLLQTPVILGTQPSADYSVTYYTSQANADAGTNAISASNATAYQSTGATIFVRVQNNTTGCYSTTSFNLIEITPIAPSGLGITGCSPIDLTAVVTQLGIPATDVTVTYYSNPADALAGINPLPDATAYLLAGTTATVSIRIVQNSTGCISVAPVTINLNPGIIPPTDLSLESCTQVNLSDVNSQLGVPLATVEVSYHTSIADALANTNPITGFTNYLLTNTTEVVYIRIRQISTNCISTAEIALTKLPPVQLDDPLALEGCSPFNLTEVTAQLEGGLTIGYYVSENDAAAQVNAIVTPASYPFSGNSGTVYIRGENTSGCFDIAPLTLTIKGCEIQRGISPGGTTGQNDNFDLAYLDVRKISIFNRYGLEVYSFKGAYTNQWGGQSSNGNELPTGAYFYVFERNNGESKTGWIYINRQN